MATLYKRELTGDNWTWVLQWIEKNPDGTTSRPKRHLGKMSKTRAKKIKAAKEAEIAESIFAELFGEEESDITPLTTAQLKIKFINIKQHEVKWNTIKLYKGMFKYLIDCFPDKLSIDFDKSDLVEFRNYLLQEKALSRASVNKHMKLLKAVFNEAVYTLKAMEENPFDKTTHNGKKFKPLPEDKKRPPVMPPEHILKFFDEFDKTLPEEFRDYTFFHTMYCIGCRPGELARLEWQYVRLNDDIPHLVFRAKDTKGKKENPVPIPESLFNDYNILDEMFPHKPSDRVYPHILLTTRSYPSRIFHKYTKRAKLDEEQVNVNYTPYWLRHTLGSTSDSPIQDISALYNHSDVKVTQKYSHRENLKTKLSVVNSYPSLDELDKQVKEKKKKKTKNQ